MAEVLIAGASGGRESILQQAMLASPEVERAEVYVDVKEGLGQFSVKEKPFVIIGPETALIAGLADKLREDGYTVLGASGDMAQYEGSKAKTVMLARKYDATQPDTYIASIPADARQFVRTSKPDDYVIKADGEAGGKGVFLPDTEEKAVEIVEGLLDGSLASGAGTEIINFAERIYGPEVSPLVLVGRDENDILVLPLAQDHKRLMDNDEGPNTGGMGAYSPLPESIVDDAKYDEIYEQMVKILAGMRAEGANISGSVFYPAYMLDENNDRKPTLLEVNVRFGDPEAQVVITRLMNAGIDVYRLLRSTAEGSIERPESNLRQLGGAALTVCLATSSYPWHGSEGDMITGLDRHYKNVSVQLAGVKNEEGLTVTDGGRVLYVTATGETVDEAAAYAYAAIGENAINFADAQYRKDIGWQARTQIS